MNPNEAARLIDISAVRTAHTLSDIQQTVEIAKKYRFINVHALPSWTGTLRDMLAGSPDIYVGAPVGFPSGGHKTVVKQLEAEHLIQDGVQELDIVMNVGRFKNKEYKMVLDELGLIIGMTPGNVLTKVIIEINALTDQEVEEACRLVTQTGADFLKTGTGWIPGPVDMDRIQRIKELTHGKIKVKMAGGLRTKDEFQQLCDMGVERFGINTQSAVKIVESYSYSHVRK